MTNSDFSVDAFKEDLIKSSASEIYSRLLMSEDVWLLRKKFGDSHREKYHALKIEISNALRVSVKNIAIVGSAKFGFSITPERQFPSFREGLEDEAQNSDIDVVLVSREIFVDLWEKFFEYLRQQRKANPNVSYAERAKNVFSHFVTFNADALSEDEKRFFNDWMQRVNAMKFALDSVFELRNPINYRVYDDWKYVDMYYTDGIEKLREEVISTVRAGK
ncbi:hypothetical protein [Herbaspirillum rubrisubalbicans]|uniref:hypothetical protein n=1 Tax=Herbaspirillum rubrisubalbicans TaxID=80842 RepID=UPI00037B7349|nr:hypothetical protein [Herbaspirillum rubrisubalbicans]